MPQLLTIHPNNPQARLIKILVDALQNDQPVIYPTESGYAFGCRMGNKQALSTIRRLKGLPEKHQFTIVCRDLKDIAFYAKVDNAQYRLLKRYLPGPYSFVLEATRQIPKLLLMNKKKTIGIRVSTNSILNAIIEQLGEPIINSTYYLEDHPRVYEPEDIIEQLPPKAVAAVVNGGYSGHVNTTLVDLNVTPWEILRQGQGEIEL